MKTVFRKLHHDEPAKGGPSQDVLNPLVTSEVDARHSKQPVRSRGLLPLHRMQLLKFCHILLKMASVALVSVQQKKQASSAVETCRRRSQLVSDLVVLQPTLGLIEARSHSNPHQHGLHCAVASTKWPRAHPSSSRPPACTRARICDPHTLTSGCHNNDSGKGP